MVAGKATGGSANAAEKVLRTLDALPDNPRLGDLARATDLPKSTVHRILQTMVSEGFVVLDESSGHYSPGPRLLGLAGRTFSRADTSAGAEPMLRPAPGADRRDRAPGRARPATRRCTCARSRATSPTGWSRASAWPIPLHCTGIGKAILAGMSDAEVRAYAKRTGLARRTPNTVTDAGGWWPTSRRSVSADGRRTSRRTRSASSVSAPAYATTPARSPRR